MIETPPLTDARAEPRLAASMLAGRPVDVTIVVRTICGRSAPPAAVETCNFRIRREWAW